MLWLLLAACVGLIQSINEVVNKRLAGTDRWTLMCATAAIQALFAWGILLARGMPSVSPEFYKLLAILAPLELLAAYAYLRGIQEGDLSATSPLSNITPALVLVLSAVFMIEGTSVLGAAGVFLIVAGAYFINNGRGMASLRSLATPSGRWVLFAATIWGVTTILGKQAVLHGSAALLIALTMSWTFMVTAIVTATRPRGSIRTLITKWPLVLVVGVLASGSLLLQNAVYIFLPAAVVISLKRTSTLWSLLWGRKVFNERFGARRVMAVMIMILGVAAIALGGGLKT